MKTKVSISVTESACSPHDVSYVHSMKDRDSSYESLGCDIATCLEAVTGRPLYVAAAIADSLETQEPFDDEDHDLAAAFFKAAAAYKAYWDRHDEFLDAEMDAKINGTETE